MFENYDPNARHHIKFHVVIHLESPLSHIGETIGNQSSLKTLTITDLEGTPSEVFVYSGNALRNGLLRRRGVDSFLETLGLKLNLKTHQTLFSGGFIDGGTANDMGLDERIRRICPPISVLGTAKPKGILGSKDAQMIAGRVQIGDAYLVCFESAEYLFRRFLPAIPAECVEGLTDIIMAQTEFNEARVNAWLSGDLDPSSEKLNKIRAHWTPFLLERLRTYPQWLTYDQKVRVDSSHDPNLKKFLAGQPSLSDDADKADKQAKTESPTKSSQMIMADWLLQEGATLYSRWDGYITDIEEGFIADALLKFSTNPYLGGKNNTGRGLCSFQVYFQSNKSQGRWLTYTGGTQILSDRAQAKYSEYQEYLTQYRSFLEEAKDSKVLKELLGVE